MKLLFGIFLLFITPALMKGGGAHPENVPCGIIIGCIGLYLCWRWWTDRGAAPAQAVSPARPDPASPARPEELDAPAPEAPAVPETPAAAAEALPAGHVTCRYCGHVYAPGETFCVQCGAIEE